jgi:hypothetical protein
MKLEKEGKMKRTTGLVMTVFFFISMGGWAYAGDSDKNDGGKPPIWEILKKGKAVHWVDSKYNRRFAIYDAGIANDSSDDLVLDKETGLVWERSPSTITFNWAAAQSHCNQLTLGNRKGWRLPTLPELGSLVDPSVPFPGPTLPAGHPFSNVQSESYWSATFYFPNQNDAWDLHFGNGAPDEDARNNEYFVWCGRGGQGVD